MTSPKLSQRQFVPPTKFPLMIALTRMIRQNDSMLLSPWVQTIYCISLLVLCFKDQGQAFRAFDLELKFLHSLLDNNPLDCDCGITPSLWTAEVTGTCVYPPHLRGVEVSTLRVEDFKCGLLHSDFYMKTDSFA